MILKRTIPQRNQVFFLPAIKLEYHILQEFLIVD